MEWFYFWVLVISLAVTLAVTLFKPEKIYEYPYFMAAAFAVFIVPQAISLIRFPGVATESAIASALLMCCLCFGMCWLGYRQTSSKSIHLMLAKPINWDRLFQGALVFMLASYFFNYLISQMTPEETGGSMWTGRVTIYGFFVQLIYPAFAICLMMALRRWTLLAWLATGVAAILPLQICVMAGRREGTVQFLLTLALVLFYERGIKPPRLAILFAVLFAMLAIPATGTYRGLAAEGEWNQVRQIDLVGNFKSYLTQESILELRNATMVIEATRQANSYEYGAAYWDQLVFRFVPAQLVGKNIKDSLMFHASDEYLDNELAKLNYELPTGSTLTGMADSFQQFAWFGCLFFAFMGILFRSLFRATQQPNPIFARLFYILIATSAMRAVTHQTLDFLPGLVYYMIFLGLLYWYAQEPEARRIKRKAGGGEFPTQSEEHGRQTPDGGDRRTKSKRPQVAPFSVTAPERRTEGAVQKAETPKTETLKSGNPQG